MTDEQYDMLPILPWMPSRIPKRQALVTFVPDGTECPEPLRALVERTQSRWYPQPGGHRVLVLYEGGPYDSSAFTVEPKSWDHEDCDMCNQRIAAMELCYVTASGDYLALCVTCYKKQVLLEAD
jgi:hypothetical protein